MAEDLSAQQGVDNTDPNFVNGKLVDGIMDSANLGQGKAFCLEIYIRSMEKRLLLI